MNQRPIPGNCCWLLLFSLWILLGGCEKALQLKDPPAPAMAVLDELWQVMDERYALFQVKEVDWKKVYEDHRAGFNNDMSNKELFKKLSAMLATLRDGHVSLISENDTATYEDFYKLYPVNFNYQNILVNYLKSDYKTSGPVIYKVVDNVAYMYYGSFRESITEEQLAVVLHDISQTKGLIIDVRNNSGGGSANVYRLMQHFVQSGTLGKYEQFKTGRGAHDFSDLTPYYIEPASPYYKQPVIVLANRSCFSACNDLVLYLSALPQVRVFGDQTGGGGSLPYEYVLANGWRLRYSGTITLSPDKQPVENGIPPDRAITITSIDETNGKDPILEQAYQALR